MAGPPAPPLGYSKFSRFRGPGARQSETDSLILIMYTTRCWVGQTLVSLLKDIYNTDEQTDRQCRSAGRQVEKHTELEFLNDLRGPGTE